MRSQTVFSERVGPPEAPPRRACRRLAACIVLQWVLLAAPGFGQANQLWPEVDTYVRLTPQTRLFISQQSTREESNATQVDVGFHLDLFLKPLRGQQWFRSHPRDESKSRYLLLRVGYHYIAPLGTSDKPENRIMLEATPRYPLRLGFVLADRNRSDLRFTPDGFSWRYRNRAALEKTVHAHDYVFDTYARAEVWYDNSCGRWSRTLVQLGAEFPIREKVSFESYYERQNNTSTRPNQQLNGVGLILNLHL